MQTEFDYTKLNFLKKYLMNFQLAWDSNIKNNEIPKKVGAHKPTKIPNLSACAFFAGSFPFVKFQIAIEPKIEIMLKTNIT